VTEADPALAVADDDQSRKAEALAALHRLRDAVDVDQLLDQLFAAVVAAGAATATIAVTTATAAVTATAIAARTAARTATATAATRTARRAAGTWACTRTGISRRRINRCINGRVGFVSHS
jgi:hypothetical protein